MRDVISKNEKLTNLKSSPQSYLPLQSAAVISLSQDQKVLSISLEPSHIAFDEILLEQEDCPDQFAHTFQSGNNRLHYGLEV